MSANFSVQFIVNEKAPQSRVLKLTDTSAGFTLAKGNFSITFPDGSTRIKTDFTSPDINTPGGGIFIPAVLDNNNNVITGTYKIDFVALDASAVSYPASISFDFNWVKPSNGITNLADVLIPEVKFQDVTSYSPIGSFTGTLSRTLTCAFPTTSEASGNTPISTVSLNIIDIVSSGKYYDGTYTPTSDVSIIYTKSGDSRITINYTELFTKTYLIKRCPTQLELVGKINNYRALIDSYKEKNDTQFNILSEQYDLVIALYSHLITRYETSTQDGSEPVLRELLSILEPYSTTYTPQSTRMLPFQIASTGTNSFTISDGTNSDTIPLGSTLLLSSGNPAFTIGVSDNMVTYTPIFGTTSNTFAQGNDSRLHNPVTIGTANGLSLATQALSLAAATTSTPGAMSASDKAKLDGIAAGANVGTVTSVGLSAPTAFTVTNSPVTGSGTIVLSTNGSPTQYITGAGALATFLTDVRAGISLTTTGTSGAATYNSTTGVLNIPQYQGGVTSFNTRTGAVTLTSGDVTTALTYTPQQPISLTTTGTSGAATFVGNTLNIPQYQGGVTSFNTRTGAITLTSGDVTTALTYTPQQPITLTTTGTSGAATFVGNTLNIPQYSGGGGSGTLRSVQNFTATAGQTTFTISGGYTVGQLDVFLNGVRLTGADYTASNGTTVVLGAGALVNDIVDVLSYAGLTGYVATASFTATSPLIYSAGNYSIQVANTSQSGYLTSTDWNTFNGKQAALGFTPYNATNPSGYTSNLGTVTSVAALTIGTTGTDVSSTVANGTTTAVITLNIPTASAANRGALTSTDWTTFNNKQATITLTTTGSSGAATFITNTLNIPTYTLAGLGGQASSTNLTSLSGLTFASTSFVKMTAAGTFALDTTAYTANTGTVTSVAALTLGTTGTDLTSSVATGTTTPVITLNVPSASASNRGVLTSADWTTFNSKQGAITLTTTGTSGAATLVGNTLNIPNYATGGGGGSVAGSNTQIQFNNSGAFGASANLTWDGTSITATNVIGSGGTAAYGVFSAIFTDGIVLDYNSGYGRISVGTGDGIQFFNGGVGAGLLASVTPAGDWDFNGNLIIGTGSVVPSSVNAILQIASTSSGYVQAYVHNDSNGTSSSSDLACYPDNGIDTSGWIDMGITSSTYSDSSYLTTGANEGYIFMSAPSGASKTGNLVFATDSTGTQNYFQWYVGGFGQAKSAFKMQLKSTALDLSIPLNSTVTTGTAPFTVASTTQVANLFATKAATVSDGSIGLTSLSATGTPSSTTYLRGDNTWATVSGGSAAGTTGQVQYNNAGSFAGAAKTKIDANGNINLASDTAPPTAAADTVTIYDSKVGGRNMIAIMDSTGLGNVIQTHIARNGVSWWSTAGNSTTIIATGNQALTATGTATAANITTTNIQTRMKRLEYLVTTAAATAVAGFRAPAAQWWMGNAAGSGGFHFICRFGPATGVATTTSRLFVGMSSSTAAPTDVEPSTQTNFFGVGYDAADTTFQFMQNAATTVTKTALTGFTVPTVDRTSMYELAMFVAPNSTTLNYMFTDLSSGATVSGTATANLPAVNTLLAPRGYSSAGGTSSVIGIALSSLYLETDY